MSTDLVSPRRPVAVRDRRAPGVVRRAQRPAVIAAARLEAASFATHVALHHTAMLSASEGRLIRQAPLGERRYEAIIDAYAGLACHEIALLAEGMR